MHLLLNYYNNQCHVTSAKVAKMCEMLMKFIFEVSIFGQLQGQYSLLCKYACLFVCLFVSVFLAYWQTYIFLYWNRTIFDCLFVFNLYVLFIN